MIANMYIQKDYFVEQPMPEDNELFDNEFMNDMLLNSKAYDIFDGHDSEDDNI